jgi:hypothetical protein
VQVDFDRREKVFALQDAAISKNGESSGARPRAVYHPSPRKFLVFRWRGYLADTEPLFPHVDVAARIIQVIAVLLALAERGAVDQQFAIDQPEDAQSRFCFRIVLFANSGFWHLADPPF